MDKSPRNSRLPLLGGVILGAALAIGVAGTLDGRTHQQVVPIPAEAFAYVFIPPSPSPSLVMTTYDSSVFGKRRPKLVYADIIIQPPAKAQKKVTRIVKQSVTSVASVSGVATWYCEPGVSICTNGFSSGGAYGAAGPELRAALGHWRGKTVYVNGVAVKLIDWCGCGGDHVIDIYHSTWVTIPNQSHVVIRW